MKNLNELAKEINENANKKGFWNNMHFAVDITKNQVRSIGLDKHVRDAFISQKLALVHSEISEAMEATRLNNYENNGYGLYEKDTFVDELADSLIRILDICGELKIDIESQVSWKMEKNKQREFMHGKNS